MKKWAVDAIEEIMDNFDFEKVHKVMTYLNWEWHHEGVPEISKLKRTAREDLKRTYKEEIPWCESGGLRVEVDREGKTMRLMFVLEYWDVE